jgi:hypothetical protein
MSQKMYKTPMQSITAAASIVIAALSNPALVFTDRSVRSFQWR